MKERMSVLLLMLVLASASACGNEGPDADGARARGLAFMGEGKYDLAIQAFDSVIAQRPNDADAYNSRGNVYAAKREPDRAIQDYDSAIKLNPNNPFAYKNRGVVYSTKDEYDRAIQDLDQAITLKPDFSGAFNSRGFAYHLKGDYERAVQDYDQSIRLAPTSAAAFRNRANARFILGRFADAASDLERSLELYEAATPPTAHLNETGAYAVVWLHVAKTRQGQDDAAEFAANSARVDSTSWPSPVIAFYSGKLTADQLVAGTATAEPRLRNDQRCGAEFFAGQAAMWKKQPAEARKRFEATRATCSKRYVEHAVAEAELRRLGASAE
jgi:lipoprotein NlpI